MFYITLKKYRDYYILYHVQKYIIGWDTPDHNLAARNAECKPDRIGTKGYIEKVTLSSASVLFSCLSPPP